MASSRSQKIQTIAPYFIAILALGILGGWVYLAIRVRKKWFNVDPGLESGMQLVPDASPESLQSLAHSQIDESHYSEDGAIELVINEAFHRDISQIKIHSDEDGTKNPTHSFESFPAIREIQSCLQLNKSCSDKSLPRIMEERRANPTVLDSNGIFCLASNEKNPNTHGRFEYDWAVVEYIYSEDEPVFQSHRSKVASRLSPFNNESALKSNKMTNTKNIFHHFKSTSRLKEFKSTPTFKTLHSRDSPKTKDTPSNLTFINPLTNSSHHKIRECNSSPTLRWITDTNGTYILSPQVSTIPDIAYHFKYDSAVMEYIYSDEPSQDGSKMEGEEESDLISVAGLLALRNGYHQLSSDSVSITESSSCSGETSYDSSNDSGIHLSFTKSKPGSKFNPSPCQSRAAYSYQ